MFFITDKNGVVQDISSRQENLSRGLGFEDHKVWTAPDMHHATIGDTYKDGLFFIDIDNLNARETRRQQEILIKDKTIEQAVVELISEGKLPPDFVLE